MLIYDYILIGILISFSLIGLFLGFIKSISKFLIMIIPPFFAYIYSEKSLLIFQEEFNFPVIGIPGTIDNDISGTQYTMVMILP